MNTPIRLLVLTFALASASCSHVATGGRALVQTLDWVAQLGLSTVQFAVGIPVSPFDKGAMATDGFRNFRATVMRPLEAADRATASATSPQTRRVRVIVLWRQPDGSIARSTTDFIDGKSQGTRYDAFFVAQANPPPLVPPTRTLAADTTVIDAVVVGDDDFEHVVIDNKTQAFAVEEIGSLVRKQPPAPAKKAELDPSVRQFLERLNEKTLDQYSY